MPNLEGHSTAVTGAGSGIGEAFAKRLASDGAKVCVLDINAEAAERVAAEITQAGGSAIHRSCDVSKREDIKAGIDATVSEFGALNSLFQIAGVSHMRPFLEVTEEQWHTTLSVNGLGVLMGMQEATHQMKTQEHGGKIINAASIGGKEGYPLFADYCASKAAVISLTQGGARALAEYGITVNAFCPGVVATPMWDHLNDEAIEIGALERKGQALEEYGAAILVRGGPATAESLAGLGSFFASRDSDQITGQAFNIDGGLMMH